MNERIKELAELAGMVKVLEEHASEYGNGMFENTPYPELEKFAELIVRECARVARNTNLEDVEGGDSAVLRAAGEQIEQYFGVQ